MKKLFLFLAASAGVMSASAELELTPLLPETPKKMIFQKASPENFVTRATPDDYLVFGYCAGINQAISLRSGSATLEAAIEIPEELSLQWIGNQVVGLRIGFGQSSTPTVNYYVTETLTGEPVIMEPGTITEFFGWNEFMFSEPFTIEGTPFYVGYQANCNANNNDGPIGVDLDLTNYSSYGDFVAINNEWDNLGPYFGNVCIQVLVSGETLPQNEAAVSDIYVPTLIAKGTPFEGGFLVSNKGVKQIKSVDYTFEIAGKTVKSGTYSFETPIPSGDFQWARFDNLVCETLGSDIVVKATITKVNGVEETSVEDNVLTRTTICSNEVYPQNVLAEEFTGTWCGWCPRGLVGMEFMSEHYSDKGFIGIAVHGSYVGQDPMVSPSYVTVANRYTSGYPGAVINRQYSFDPSDANLELYYLLASSEPSAANIEILSAEYSLQDEAVIVKCTSKFAIDLNTSSLQLAFALVEDGVGPYAQSNYFSGGKEGTQYYLEGWSDKGAYVPTVYNEVGRIIKDPFGIPNSLPASVKEGQGYDYTVSIPVSASWKLENSYVVAMILDTTSGFVVNSTKCEEIANADAGVDGIAEDADGVYKVYNIQGVKVLESKDAAALESLPKGVYIINGKKVYKR